MFCTINIKTMFCDYKYKNNVYYKYKNNVSVTINIKTMFCDYKYKNNVSVL